MDRVLLIIVAAGVFMATGVAGADVATPVRHPATEVATPETPLSREDSVIVERGDHLWKISARHLGPEASDGEISPYWREVIEVNIPNLRSGDPDLIYPGEIVALPAASEQP